MSKTDKAILLFAVALAFASVAYYKLIPRVPSARLTVKASDTSVFSGSLREVPDSTILAKGPVGKSVVEVKGGRAHMLYSDCPDKVCIGMGWIDKPGQVVVCLPNKVIISIVEAGAGE